MRGVVIRKIEKVHEDDRRSIMEIMNGELNVKNLKILDVKETCYLGGKEGHWHQYPEVMCILKGKAIDYTMTNIDTNETEVFQLEEGDVVFRTGRIIHGGIFEGGSLVVDGSCEMYISADFNDIPR